MVDCNFVRGFDECQSSFLKARKRARALFLGWVNALYAVVLVIKLGRTRYVFSFNLKCRNGKAFKSIYYIYFLVDCSPLFFTSYIYSTFKKGLFLIYFL